MRKIINILIALLLIITFSSCQNNTNDGQPQPSNTTDNNEQINMPNSTDDDMDNENNEQNMTEMDVEQTMMDKMKHLPYSEIEIEIDYPNGKEFEVEIEKNSNGHYEAEVEDEINNRFAEGEEAFDFIYNHIEHIMVTQSSEKKAIIQDVLEAFNLDHNYEKLEIEITFHDGTKIEYND